MNNEEQFNDNVVHPAHYNKHASGVETIYVARHIDFDLGNALKYLMRFRYKNNPCEDLKKAIFYLRDKINTTSTKVKLNQFTVKVNSNFTNEVYKAFVNIICAEKNIYIKNALKLIMEYALFNAPLVADQNDVVNALENHITDILKEDRVHDTLELANELYEAIEESDHNEKTNKKVNIKKILSVD